MANTPRLVTTKQADALAELYVWDTVVEILEGSTAPRDESGQKAARKVIAIAKAEQKKLFRKYDAEARHDDFAALQAEVEALRSEGERLAEALECMIIGACAVAVPHNGERAVLQDAVNIARAALAAYRQEPPHDRRD